jgi:hypothetical protein
MFDFSKILESIKAGRPGNGLMSGLQDQANRQDQFAGLTNPSGQVDLQNPAGVNPLQGLMAGIAAPQSQAQTPPIMGPRPGDSGPGEMRGGGYGMDPEQAQRNAIAQLIRQWMQSGQARGG